MIQLEQVRQRACEFDIIHFHTDLFQMPLGRALEVPSVTTLHGRLDLPDLRPFYPPGAQPRRDVQPGAARVTR